MSEPLLAVAGLNGFYGAAQALFDVTLQLREGETLALIGANGAGKSTLLRTIIGLRPSPREAVRLDGRPVGGLPANELVSRGMALVPEGRRLFPTLTVEENLLIGGQLGRPGRWTLGAVYDLFPALKSKRTVLGPLLSGGQQQMVAIGRALMSNPRLLLLDEISLGLAPVVIEEIYAALPDVIAHGTATVLVEQDIGRALRTADRFVCLREGRIVLEGVTGDAVRTEITEAYFGAHA